MIQQPLKPSSVYCYWQTHFCCEQTHRSACSLLLHSNTTSFLLSLIRNHNSCSASKWYEQKKKISVDIGQIQSAGHSSLCVFPSTQRILRNVVYFFFAVFPSSIAPSKVQIVIRAQVSHSKASVFEKNTRNEIWLEHTPASPIVIVSIRVSVWQQRKDIFSFFLFTLVGFWLSNRFGHECSPACEWYDAIEWHNSDDTEYLS